MRKTVLATAAAIALGAAAMTPALAQHHGGGGGGGGFGGGGGAHVMGGGPATGGGGFSGMHMAAPSGGNFAAPRGNVGGNFAAARPNASVAPRNFAAPHNNFAANGWARGGHDFDHDRDHGRFRHRGPFFAFGFGPTYYDYDDTYAYADGCWQRQLVPTAYGLRWEWVDVCE